MTDGTSIRGVYSDDELSAYTMGRAPRSSERTFVLEFDDDDRLATFYLDKDGAVALRDWLNAELR